jgi:hypothetical protein
MPRDCAPETDAERWRDAHKRATSLLFEVETRLALADFERKRQERREADSKREPLKYRLRRKELRLLTAVRHGFDCITDVNEHAHVDVVLLAAHYLASPYRANTADVVREYCGRCSPAVVDGILLRAKAIKPTARNLNARAIGQRLCLTSEERARLNIQTIQAFDETPQDATRRRRERERVTGAKSRAKRRPDTSGRTCESCGTPIPDGRTTRRFCGDTCKKRWQRQHKKAVPLTVTDQGTKYPYMDSTDSGTATASRAPFDIEHVAAASPGQPSAPQAEHRSLLDGIGGARHPRSLGRLHSLPGTVGENSSVGVGAAGFASGGR